MVKIAAGVWVLNFVSTGAYVNVHLVVDDKGYEVTLKKDKDRLRDQRQQRRASRKAEREARRASRRNR